MKKFIKCLGISLLTVVISSCSGDETGTVQPSTIADIASTNANLTTLVAALDRAGLVATLDAAGTYTVFAPTNAAFTAYLGAGVSVNDVPVATLREILLNHVIATELTATALPSDGYIKTLGKGAASATNTLSMYVKKTGTAVRLNGVSSVTAANIDASNGVIHIVDAVIGLPTIVTHATANDTFDSLVAALTSNGQPDFVSILSGTGPFTVFAPTNDAFASLAMELSGLGVSPTPAQLTSVLKYHVTGGNVLAADLPGIVSGPTAGMVTMLNMQDITISLTGGAKIIGAFSPTRISNVIVTDVQCSNGVVHVLDKVLLPEL